VLGADGIVGVRLEIEFKELATTSPTFVAVGTAVKSGGTRAGVTNTGKRFTSDLSGQISDTDPGRIRTAGHGDGIVRLPRRAIRGSGRQWQHRAETWKSAIHRGAV